MRQLSNEKKSLFPRLTALIVILITALTGCRDAAPNAGNSEENYHYYKNEITRKHILYSEKAFVYFAGAGDAHVVELFIKSGMDLNARDENGRTPLIAASHKGSFEVAKLLIDAGASVNQKSKYGETALIAASGTNNNTLIKFLISHGANIHDKESSGKTALLEAASKGAIDTAKFLTENGADINARDNAGDTPLLASPHNKGHDLIAFFLDHGADINARGQFGVSALFKAFYNKNLELMRYLLKRGADINTRDDQGNSMLMRIDPRDNTQLIAMATFLLDNGASINAQNNKGTTALMVASQNGNYELVQLLMNHGGNIEIRDKFGNTALSHYALIGRNDRIVKLLTTKSHGHNIRDNNGNTVLINAAVRNDIPAIKLMLAEGADINASNNEGRTALMWAAYGGYKELIKLLLENGAHLNSRDKRGNSALMIAADEGHYDLAKELKAYGAEMKAGDNVRFSAVDIIEPYEGQQFQLGQKTRVVVKPQFGEKWAEVLLTLTPMKYNLFTQSYVQDIQIPADRQPGEIEIAVHVLTKSARALTLKRKIITQFPKDVVLQDIAVENEEIHLHKLPPGSDSGKIGAYETHAITFYGVYSDGVRRGVLQDSAATYSSDNVKVATVTKTGLIEAQDIGTAHITVRYGNFIKNAKVIVDPHKNYKNGIIKQQLILLKNENPQLRAGAATYLGNLKASGTVNELLEAFDDDNDQVRMAAASAVGQIKEQRTIPILIRILRDGNISKERAAAYALGLIGDKRAVHPLITALKEEDLAPYAAEALGKIGDTRAIEPLIELLGKRGWWGRDEAVNALLRFRDPRIVNLLISVLDDESIADYARRALIGMKDPQTISSLISAVKNAKSNSRIRYEAGSTLSLMGVLAVEPLIQCLKAEDWTSREIAAYFLGEMKDWRAVSPLIALLKEDRGTIGTRYAIRDISVKSLRKITGQNFGDDYETWKKWHDAEIGKRRAFGKRDIKYWEAQGFNQ